VRLTDADIEAAVDVYRSGWLSMGPRTQELEHAFSEYTGSGHCLAVSSCTAGLHLAMSGVGLGPGDEALVPSITFVARQRDRYGASPRLRRDAGSTGLAVGRHG
jgi:perosamine synthetase